jgi:hypothetical protein
MRIITYGELITLTMMALCFLAGYIWGMARSTIKKEK